MSAVAPFLEKPLIPRELCRYQPRGEVIVPAERNYIARANSDEARRERAFSERLGEEMIRMNQAGEAVLPDAPMRHFFADGCYVRELFMPAGAVVVAMIHKHEHVAIVVFGDFYLVDGKTQTRMTGPNTFISEPGAKRNFVVLADTLITTVHRLRDPECTDIEVAERMFFCETESEFQEYLLTCTDEAMI